MADEWDYLVPRLHGSAWDKGESSRFVADLDWPTIGVYCPHEPQPWLLGSFRVSAAVLEERGVASWSWTPDYVTGDGYTIRLRRQSESGHTQQLVGNEPYDRKVLEAELAGTVDKFGVGPEAMAISERMDSAAANLRGRPILECGECGDRRVYQSESVQAAVALLWEHGRREIALDEFHKFKDTLRRVGHAT